MWREADLHPLRTHRRDRGNWNGQFFKASRLVAVLCPRCQTPEENTEAEINLATTDYGVNAFGIPVGRPTGVA